jgi:hypothetical protein
MSAIRVSRPLGLALLAALALVAPIAAQDPGAGEMTPEQKAMMEAWMKASTPGAPHAQLAASAGTWDVASTWWMEPGKEPEKSTGTAERTMILGGRVMVEKFNGSMMGQPFEGMGTTGFDNVSQKYWSTWMDSMSTGMMMSTGTCEGSKCEFTGTYNDAMTGGQQTMRMVSEHGADSETMVMYGPGLSSDSPRLS